MNGYKNQIFQLLFQILTQLINMFAWIKTKFKTNILAFSSELIVGVQLNIVQDRTYILQVK